MSEDINASSDSESTVLWLVKLQIMAALIIGISIIGAVVYIGIVGDSALEDRVFETLANWGGTVIGFFFGSMLTQNTKLIEAVKARPS